MGCAGFARFAAELEAELGVPVLDGVVCATKQAELLVGLGLKTSKRKTYRPPERKRFTGMFKPFRHRPTTSPKPRSRAGGRCVSRRRKAEDTARYPNASRAAPSLRARLCAASSSPHFSRAGGASGLCT